MKVFFTIDHENFTGASNQTLQDSLIISKERGYKAVQFRSPSSIFSLFLGAVRADNFLTIYPYFCRPINNRLRRIELLITRLASLRARSLVYVVDLPIEQNLAAGQENYIDKASRNIERNFFNSFDKILVFNENMMDVLISNYGLSKEKFVFFEILDYIVTQPLFIDTNLKPPYQIAYAGDLHQNSLGGVIDSIVFNDDVIFNFYGKDGEWISNLRKRELRYHGMFSTTEILKQLTPYNHFGLISRGEQNDGWQKYHELTSTSKFSSYMVSGTPILVPKRYKYISDLVSKYNVGISFDEMSDIPEILCNLGQVNYSIMRRNAFNLGTKISNGYYLKTALNTAMGNH